MPTELAPGYAISRLIKGGWQLAGGHGTVDRERAINDMAAYVDAGINTFDCADIYTGVEALIGEFLRRYTGTGAVKVHTKCVPDYNALSGLTKAGLQATIDRSLQRLGRERLDLVQFHWWNYAVPRYVEAAQWLAELRRAGKIDLLGVTNFDTARLAEIVVDAGVPIVSAQVQYSLLDNRPERDLVELCRRHGIQLLCYGTLAGGFISERWLGRPDPGAEFANRSLVKYKLIIDDAGGWDWFQALLTELAAVAERHNVSIANVATRYVLERPQVAAVIVGARYAEHLADNLRALRFPFGPADQTRLDAVLAQRRPLAGDVYALERDKTGRHGRIMKYNLNEEKP